MHLSAGFLTGLSQGFEEVVTVYFVEKDILAAVPAAHEVIHGPRIFDAEPTRHDGLVAQPCWRVKHRKQRPKLWVDPWVKHLG